MKGDHYFTVLKDSFKRKTTKLLQRERSKMFLLGLVG